MELRICVLAATLTLALLTNFTSVSAQEAVAGQGGVVTVELDTSEGPIVLELDAAKAPKTVENFLAYIERDHFTGTVFHRVIPGFMIQGGGMDLNLKEKETLRPISNESGNGLTNDKYTVAMARTGDPHSATSQFFINVSDKNGFLNRAEAQDGWGYAVFGKVVKGTDVVDKIAAKPTRPTPNPAFPAMLMQDVPVEPIVLKSVKVLSKAE